MGWWEDLQAELDAQRAAEDEANQDALADIAENGLAGWVHDTHEENDANSTSYIQEINEAYGDWDASHTGLIEGINEDFANWFADTGRGDRADGNRARAHAEGETGPGPPHAQGTEGGGEDCDTHLLESTFVTEADDPCLPGVGSCGGAPCVDPVNCSSTSTELDEAAEGIGFGEAFGIGSFTSDEKDFVTAAYALLQANSDLVEFACCAAFGPNSAVCDCVMDFVNDVGLDLDIRDGDSGKCGPIVPRTEAYATGFNNLSICDCTFDTYLDDFLSGGSDTDCATANLAYIMAHETAHFCGTTHQDFDEWAPEWVVDEFEKYLPEFLCDPTDEFGELLKTALLTRCDVDTDCKNIVSECIP